MTRELLVSSKSWNPRNPWLPLKTGGCPGLLGIYSGGRRQVGDRNREGFELLKSIQLQSFPLKKKSCRLSWPYLDLAAGDRRDVRWIRDACEEEDPEKNRRRTEEGDGRFDATRSHLVVHRWFFIVATNPVTDSGHGPWTQAQA
jgi:hypothetical protein